MSGALVFQVERGARDLAGALRELARAPGSAGFTGGDWFFGVEGREYLPGELGLPDVQDRVLGAVTRAAVARGWTLRVTTTPEGSLAALTAGRGTHRAGRGDAATAAAVALIVALHVNPPPAPPRWAYPRFTRGPLWPFLPFARQAEVRALSVTRRPRTAVVRNVALRLLRERPLLTATEVAGVTGQSASAASVLLAGLWKRGVLRREGIGGGVSPFRYALVDA